MPKISRLSKGRSAALIPRSLQPIVEQDLAAKMVFVAGPRQCGKTTLARQILERFDGEYFNWDVAAHRRALRADQLPDDASLWVFDELHKLRTWRSWLKGLYDMHGDRHGILVTGSARLDAYRRGGDSLQGRYFLHRLHPFTLAELCGGLSPEAPDELPKLARTAPSCAPEYLTALLRYGGFPEPLLSASERTAARWRLAHNTRLVREDVRDLENLRDLDKLELLLDILPEKVGSLLSINNLRGDLEVAFETVASWLSVLERLYAVFRVAPFGPPRVKAVKKSQKLYFWDWGLVADEASRAENMVMLHLLRLVHWLADVHGEKAELCFFRDAAGHEVDAVVLRRRKPWLAVEVKLDDRPLDRGLRYLVERVGVPWAYQVSLKGTADRFIPDVGRGVRLLPAARLLANLP